jgi:hypothetical protein
MLDEHRQEFGIDLTQDAPGFGAARLVHTALTLPQLKEQLNLPAQAPKDEVLRFGLAGDHPPSQNPFVVAFHEWWRTLKDAWSARETR